MYDELAKNNAADNNNLVKKNDYKLAKIAEIAMKIFDHDHDHDNKYISTQVFNKLTAENLTARVNQANLATKSDIDNFVENTDFDNKLENLNKKVTSNKSEHVEAEKKN